MTSPEYDIVCIARSSWNDLCRSSTIRLMRQLAQQHRVLYVAYASSWMELFLSLLKLDFKKIFRMVGLKSRVKLIRVDNKRLASLTLPPLLPLNFLPPGVIYNFLNELNSWVAKKVIRKAMARLEMMRPVVINVLAPGIGVGLLHQLRERVNLYYCPDEKQRERSRPHRQMEEQFAKDANAILVSSEVEQKEKSFLNPKTFVLNDETLRMFSEIIDAAIREEKQTVTLKSADKK